MPITFWPNPAPTGHYTIEQTIRRVVEHRGLEIIEADAIVQRAIIDRKLVVYSDETGKLAPVRPTLFADIKVWVPASSDATAVPAHSVYLLKTEQVENWLTEPSREWAKAAQAVAYNRFFALMMSGPSEKRAEDYIDAAVEGDAAIPGLSERAAQDAWWEARRNTTGSVYAESWGRRGPKTRD